MRRTFSLVLVLALGLLGLIGCGGDDDDDSDALSKEAFIEQGDAICADLDTATGLVDNAASEAEFGDYIREVTGLAEQARDDFAALQPPDDGQSVHQSLLDAIDAAIEQANGAAAAADDGDTVTAGDLLAAADDAGDAADEEARDYGFEECGKPSDPSRSSGGRGG